MQNIFLEDVMSLKAAIGEYGNQFLKPVATFSFSTHGTLYRNMLSAMCIESSRLIGCQQYDNLYGNGYSRVRTIFLKS